MGNTKCNCRAAQGSIATTNLPDGRVIDWIPVDSQGEIAAAPPKPEPKSVNQAESELMTSLPAVPELEMEGIECGPPGTVPILRETSETEEILAKLRYKPSPSFNNSARAIPTFTRGIPRMAGASQQLTHYGAGADINVFVPKIEQRDDYSLLELIVARIEGASDSNIPSERGNQSVEAGVVTFPSYLGESARLFTWFTTCGNRTDLDDYDDKQGWNRFVSGWKQIDTTIYPGTAFQKTSSIGGDQFYIQLLWRLHDDNWWLLVNERWIGYYPAELFRRGRVPPKTLSDHADLSYAYGEVWDSEWTETNRAGTKTDMGSGRFPREGYKYAAYIKNIVLQPFARAPNDLVDFDGHKYTSDDTKYDVDTNFKSNTVSGSYMYVGGPGRV